MKPLNQKKLKKLIMYHYYDDETLKDAMSISRKAALDWIEEANHFFHKVRGKQWLKDEEMMKKIGW
jgi:hypothetical protein